MHCNFCGRSHGTLFKPTYHNPVEVLSTNSRRNGAHEKLIQASTITFSHAGCLPVDTLRQT